MEIDTYNWYNQLYGFFNTGDRSTQNNPTQIIDLLTFSCSWNSCSEGTTHLYVRRDSQPVDPWHSGWKTELPSVLCLYFLMTVMLKITRHNKRISILPPDLGSGMLILSPAALSTFWRARSDFEKTGFCAAVSTKTSRPAYRMRFLEYG